MAYTVLVIDDSLTLRKIMETSLQRAGMPPFTFSDGLEAMQALMARQVPLPDAVILGVGLPNMDGYAVARALRRQHALRQTIILVRSGHAGRLDQFRGRLAGANVYVTKPFHPTRVIELLCWQFSAHKFAEQAAGEQALLRPKPRQSHLH
jgi:twitching motility two-component system response regulator PilG